METTSRQTQCPVSKILQRYIKELKLNFMPRGSLALPDFPGLFKFRIETNSVGTVA